MGFLLVGWLAGLKTMKQKIKIYLNTVTCDTLLACKHAHILPSLLGQTYTQMGKQDSNNHPLYSYHISFNFLINNLKLFLHNSLF